MRRPEIGELCVIVGSSGLVGELLSPRCRNFPALGRRAGGAGSLPVSLDIRQLRKEDAQALWNLRHEALEREPLSFSESLSEFRPKTVEEYWGTMVHGRQLRGGGVPAEPISWPWHVSIVSSARSAATRDTSGESMFRSFLSTAAKERGLMVLTQLIEISARPVRPGLNPSPP